MQLPLQPIPVPLRPDGRGGYRVGGTRVSLDLLLREYHQGASPEAIVAAYPTLGLPEVHFVLGYYLVNRADVEAYLRQREKEAAELQRWAEARHPAALREHLEQYGRQEEAAHAPPGD